jgi:hypothetical protein
MARCKYRRSTDGEMQLQAGQLDFRHSRLFVLIGVANNSWAENSFIDRNKTAAIPGMRIPNAIIVAGLLIFDTTGCNRAKFQRKLIALDHKQ